MTPRRYKPGADHPRAGQGRQALSRGKTIEEVSRHLEITDSTRRRVRLVRARSGVGL